MKKDNIRYLYDVRFRGRMGAKDGGKPDPDFFMSSSVLDSRTWRGMHVPKSGI